jgi:hypothetical protein
LLQHDQPVAVLRSFRRTQLMHESCQSHPALRKQER